jgi:hypothetical protein
LAFRKLNSLSQVINSSRINSSRSSCGGAVEARAIGRNRCRRGWLFATQMPAPCARPLNGGGRVARAAAVHANSDFNLLNANLVVATGARFIVIRVDERLGRKAEAAGPWAINRRHAMKTLTTALTGMAVCTALAMFAGNADAHVNKTAIHTTNMARGFASSLPERGRIASLRAKGGPLHDCVHVLFPQCSRGYGEPND